jgi:peptidoglycan/LPS O-acetylase OafA/YrhL
MNVSSPETKIATVHERRPALPALAGIRSLAAICIMLFHFTPAGLQWAAHPWVSLYPVVNIGFVFVSFFFVLSGFILTYNYAERKVKPVDFMVARLARLYPIYLLTLIISIPMIVAEWHARSHSQFFEGMLLTPLLLQSLLPKLATFSNTVAWALSCEAIFYLAFPWLVQLRWPRSTGTLLAILLVLWVVGITPHILYLHFDPDHLGHIADRYSGGFWLSTLKYTPLPFACTFVAGVALGHLHDALQLSQRARTAVGVVGFAGAWIFIYHFAAQTPYVLIVGGIITPLFLAMTLGLAGPGVLARVFSVWPLMIVGTASYALYLMHFNVFILLHTYNIPARLGLARVDPWISYAFIILLAMAATRWVEQPAQRAIAQWWKQRRA